MCAIGRFGAASLPPCRPPPETPVYGGLPWFVIRGVPARKTASGCFSIGPPALLGLLGERLLPHACAWAVLPLPGLLCFHPLPGCCPLPPPLRGRCPEGAKGGNGRRPKGVGKAPRRGGRRKLPSVSFPAKRVSCGAAGGFLPLPGLLCFHSLPGCCLLPPHLRGRCPEGAEGGNGRRPKGVGKVPRRDGGGRAGAVLTDSKQGHSGSGAGGAGFSRD